MAGSELIGGAAWERLEGTLESDTIYGNDGNDWLLGLDGDDLLYGGPGSDAIEGGAGDDTLSGDDGDDILYSSSGSDSLLGGSGNDILDATNRLDAPPATMILDGGAGNDAMFYGVRASADPYWIAPDQGTLVGGEGDDLIEVGAIEDIRIDAGEGEDVVILDLLSPSASITLGSGQDIFLPRFFGGDATGTVEIEDFAAGADGDRIVFDELLGYQFPTWRGGNPFLLGLLNARQVGGDVVIEMSAANEFSGPSGDADGYVVLFKLNTVNLSDLLEYNLGWTPTGENAAARVIQGTPIDETIRGFSGDDLVEAGAGHDIVFGYAGNDLINGGDGWDSLYGGRGDDIIRGGVGGDYIFDDFGNDTLLGEDGNDFIEVVRDAADLSVSTVLIDGGADGDELSFRSSGNLATTLTIIGGTGDDAIYVGLTADATISAGDGDDVIDVEVGGGPVLVDLGAGFDTLRLVTGSEVTDHIPEPVTVKGLTPGDNGDAIDWVDLLLSGIVDWDGASNPYESGYLRLVQKGSDAQIQFDASGTGEGFAPLLILLDVAARDLTPAQTGWVAEVMTDAQAGTASGDFDGDGKGDLLWRSTDGAVTTWLARGAAFNASSFYAQVPTDWSIASTGDFNGDGRADILWRHSKGAVTTWLADGDSFNGDSGFFANVGIEWSIAGTGDFDGDGRDDIIWRHSGGGVTSWLSTGSTFNGARGFYAHVGSDWSIAGIGDFDGDGLDDLLWRSIDGGLTTWLSVGATFEGRAAPYFQVGTDWSVAGVGDFNGDGLDDLLWRHDSGAATSWLSNGSSFNGNSGFYAQVDSAWSVAGVADFDGDSRDDLMWRHRDGAVTDWLSNGTSFEASGSFFAQVSAEWMLV